jgi:hypothetical protein
VALYRRAQRTAAGLKSARRHGWVTPDRTAEEVNTALQAGDEDWAFKLIVQARDHLAEMLKNEDPASDAWLVRRGIFISDRVLMTLNFGYAATPR